MIAVGRKTHRELKHHMTRLDKLRSAITSQAVRLPTAFTSRTFRLPDFRALNLKHALAVLAGIVVLAVVVVIVSIVIILSGPTELGFVRDRIASALATRLGDEYEVSVGAAVVDVDPVYGLVLRVDNVAVRDDQGSIVANVPSTRLDIDPAALFAFRLDVQAVELNNAELAFARAATGRIYLGNSRTRNDVALRAQAAEPDVEADEGGFPTLLAALHLLDRGIEPAIKGAADAGLRRFAFNNGTIDFWDAARAQLRHFPRSDLAIALDPVTSTFNATLATSGYSGRWTAEVERDVDVSSGGRSLSVVFSQLTLADILPNLGDRNNSVTADIPLYGRATVRYDRDGEVADAAVRLDFGAGVYRFSEGNESILLDEATVKLRWDANKNAIIVEPSTIFFGESRGVVVGTITPEGDPAFGRYRYDLESRGAILAPDDSHEPPLIAQRIAVSGTADLAERLLTFDNAVLQTPLGTVAAAGSLGFEGQTPSLAMAASISEMPIAAAKQIWIPLIAPGARRWVLEHVSDGRIVSGKFEAAIPGGLLWTGRRPQLPDEMLRLEMRLEDVSFTTIGDLPPVRHASGVAVLAGSTFGIDLEAGVIEVPSGETVTIDAGAFAVANTAQRYPEGVVEMQVSGEAGPLGEIADADPFLALQRQQITPADLSGTADASLSVRLPLRPDVSEADIDWRVSIDGVDLASKAPIVGRNVSDADVNIIVTPVDVTVRGTAKIDDVPADIDMSHPIAGGDLAAGSGQQMVRLNLDDAARKRLGIGLDDILAGSVGTFVSNAEGDRAGQHYDLDLKRARLVLPGLGWSKGIGVPASLSFDLIPNDGGYAVEQLTLAGANFGFSGTAQLDSAYGLVSADISHFSLRKGDEISFEMRRSKNGYAITARGKSFDMRGILASLRTETVVGNQPDIAVDAQIEKLTGYNQEAVTGAKVSLHSVAGVTRKLTFLGKLGGSDLVATYSDTREGASLQLSSPDGGRVMRFANLYSRINGGNLRVDASRPGPTGPLVGTFDLNNFAIVGEPAMERVVATSTRNDGGGRTGVDPNHIRFERMVINFAKTDQAITISDALLRGTTVGATFNGRFDLATSNMSINGTYLPSYQFNNFFGRIPILGLALGGGASEGLIGVTFKIQGTMDEPQLFINPLSAVAPGIFRKIFEFQ
jgi:hypothetical protein